MDIKWFGHSCFKITSDKGISIITDPFDDSVGYKVPKTSADIVTVSHDHYDHNYVDAVEGEYELINKIGLFYVRDININGIPSFHDNDGGKKRGSNIIFTYDIAGIRLCHLGDLGHTLDEDQISKIGGVDVLFIPVGGYYTINAVEAKKVVDQISPRIIIPMHYKTPVIDFPIATEEEFVSLIGGAEYVQSDNITLDEGTISSGRKLYVLKY